MVSIHSSTDLGNEFPTDKQRAAFRLVREMLAVEKTLLKYEVFATAHQDTRQRIADLFVLDAWYKSKFGVAFHQRHEFRSYLIELLNEKTRSNSDHQSDSEFQRAEVPEQIVPMQTVSVT